MEEEDAGEGTHAQEGQGEVRVGRLRVHTGSILGHGSQGTIVYVGELDGRKVAVKRLLSTFVDVALGEVDLLMKADAHPNITRYFAKEEDGDFIYLALELCDTSLASHVEEHSNANSSDISAEFCRRQEEGAAQQEPVSSPSESNVNKSTGARDVCVGSAQGWMEVDRAQQLLADLLDGVSFLHSMGIVHRDLKPGNVLLTAAGRIKISDMGFSKRLDNGQSSFDTVHAGTMGWRAPELLLKQRCTKSVDIFAVGCIFYYVLTHGHHAFGEWLERDSNIVRDRTNLSLLDHWPEAQDLIAELIRHDSSKRPTAAEARKHPFFWSKATCLRFLLDCSDRVENEDASSLLVTAMERRAQMVFASPWNLQLDSSFIATLLERRKYNYNSLRDLLRAIRNKKNHFRELPQAVQDMLGGVPDGYMLYFKTKFPRIILEMYLFALETELTRNEAVFSAYLSP